MIYSRSGVVIRVRWALLGWLFLGGIMAAQTPQPGDQSAATGGALAGPEFAILNDAASVYRGASNLQLKGMKLYERHDQFVDNVTRTSFTLILTSDNRFRQEAKSQSGTVLQGCDGQRHWTYFVTTNKYSTVPATPDPIFLFNSRIDLRFLTDRLLSAQLLRQEDFQTDSGNHRCDVIQAHYERAHLSGNVEYGDVLFWIDHNSHWVWKTRTETETKVGDSGAKRAAFETTEYTDVQMNLDLPADTFAFAPPPGATEQATPTPAPRQALLGRPAPDFKLRSLDGEEVQLSELKGKVVLLDFWASWSEASRAAIPTLNSLFKKFRKQDVVIVAIDQYEDEQTVRTFVGNNRYGYPTVLCPRGNPAIDSYSVRTLPTLVLIDKSGLVSDYRVGYASETEETLRAALVRVSGPDYVPPQLAETAPAGVYSVGGDVTEPVPIYKPDPPYSKEALKAKYQGTVVLWITIDTSGAVSDCRVVKPLGFGLDENAVETVKTWKFNPAMRLGTPVPVRVMVQVTFRLGKWAASAP
ncbi:MAG: TonB family protein [Terriglobia bacterium]|jgi:TonB family protein